jgi:hypothetical protein
VPLDLYEFESNEFKLKEENERLKAIVKQMRDDMENLANGSSPNDLIPTKQSSNNKPPLVVVNSSPSNGKILTPVSFNQDDFIKYQIFYQTFGLLKSKLVWSKLPSHLFPFK